MPTHLTTTVLEESTLVVSAELFDEDENRVTPASLTWTLMTGDGEIVNGREAVPVTEPGAVNDIVLSGDDLALPDPADRQRLLLFEGVYHSTLGLNLPVKDSASFRITDLVGVV